MSVSTNAKFNLIAGCVAATIAWACGGDPWMWFTGYVTGATFGDAIFSREVNRG